MADDTNPLLGTSAPTAAPTGKGKGEDAARKLSDKRKLSRNRNGSHEPASIAIDEGGRRYSNMGGPTKGLVG